MTDTDADEVGNGLEVAAERVVGVIDELLADREGVTGRPGAADDGVPVFDSSAADLRRRSSDRLHQEQLRGVLERAGRQARAVRVEGISRADPDLALWQLSRPGYLREIADRPVTNSMSALFLLPVGLTWLVLGVFEAQYAVSHYGIDVKERPPFFADWIAGPWYRGPWMLSFAIVVTILGLAWLARRSNAVQRRADQLDDVVRSWEIALHGPVEQLRELAAEQRYRRRPDEAMVRAAVGMQRAAEETTEAAKSLGRTGPLIGELATNLKKLSTAIAALRAATPELAVQVTALREVDAGIRASAAETRTTLTAAVEEIRSHLRASAEQTGTLLNATADRTAGVLEGAARSAASALDAAGRHTHDRIVAAVEQTDASLRSATSNNEDRLRGVAADTGELIRETTGDTAAALKAAVDGTVAALNCEASAISDRLAASAEQVDGRMRTTTAEIIANTGPLTSVIRDTSEVADAVRRILDELSLQIRDTRTISDQAEVFRAALSETGKPFVAATETLGSAAKTLDSAVKSLNQTAERLTANVERAQELIEQVDAYSLMVDGIRNDVHEHNGHRGRDH